MTTKEVGHIRNDLNQGGRVEQPHYVSESYQAGRNVEGGFEVKDKPETPEHITVRVGPTYIVDDSDMTPPYALPENQPTEHTQVIRAGNTVRYVMEDETTEADRRAEQAEAAARAVKAAIMRGEIDADLFSD